MTLQGDDADLVVLVGVLHQTASLVAPLTRQRLAPLLDGRSILLNSSWR
jgi:hypothetical protein